MTLKFRCEKCHKTVEAPDSAAGRRGKCPYCGATSYVPQPEAEEIPLAPIDEAEERRHQQEVAELIATDRDLLGQTGGDPGIPLEHKEDLSSEDLHHLVVNYCLDMVAGKLSAAGAHVKKLKPFKFTAIQAVEDFQTNKSIEPALIDIPQKVLDGYLVELKKDLQ